MGEGSRALSSEEMRALVARATSAVKVFPLHGVVVLPGMPTPLHIFEARYRALVADALAGDRLLAVAALTRPETAPHPRAPVLAVAGLGFIEEEESLQAGRYNILLRGVARVRLVEELERGKAYREFRVEVLDDVHPQGGQAALAAEVETLERAVYELATLLPSESGARQLAEAAARLRTPSRLADLVAAAVVSEPEARQAILEEIDVGLRLRRVASEVAGVLALVAQGKAPKA